MTKVFRPTLAAMMLLSGAVIVAMAEEPTKFSFTLLGVDDDKASFHGNQGQHGPVWGGVSYGGSQPFLVHHDGIETVHEPSDKVGVVVRLGKDIQITCNAKVCTYQLRDEDPQIRKNGEQIAYPIETRGLRITVK